MLKEKLWNKYELYLFTSKNVSLISARGAGLSAGGARWLSEEGDFSGHLDQFCFLFIGCKKR
jgi:hypothetical protein